MESLMAPMLNKELEENRLRIVQVHDSVVKRVSEVSLQHIYAHSARFRLESWLTLAIGVASRFAP